MEKGLNDVIHDVDDMLIEYWLAEKWKGSNSGVHQEWKKIKINSFIHFNWFQIQYIFNSYFTASHHNNNHLKVKVETLQY